MRTRATVLTFVLATMLALACGGSDAAPADPWVLRPDRLGPVPLGAPLAAAEAALGTALTVAYADFETCDYVSTPAMPPGTALMVLRDSVGRPSFVERADVDSAGIRTAEGAGVGDTEARVLALYGPRARVTPHPYDGPEGHYVTVSVPGDTTRLLIFETDGRVVTSFRAGRRPAVEYIEGCA